MTNEAHNLKRLRSAFASWPVPECVVQESVEILTAAIAALEAEPLAVVEGWMNDSDYNPETGKMRHDSYFWLWRETPPELAGVCTPVTVTITERKT